jgi:hypothetical protein
MIPEMRVFARLSCLGLFVACCTLSLAAKVQKKKLVLSILVFALLFCLSINLNVAPSSGLGEPWWNPDWAYRKKGVIWHTKVAADLTNFPVLISLTDSDLASRAQANGGDIVFTDQSGTKLDHEIEFFNQATGNLVAWVRFLTLSSTVDTQFFIYYGNPNAPNQQNPASVWDPNFLAVYHLGEKSGNTADSTLNHKYATTTQVTTYRAPGKIGYAMEFRSSKDYVQLPQVFTTATQFTFSAWINASVGARYFISQWTNNRGAFLQVYGNTVEFYINGLRVATKPITLNEWHYVVGTFDGTTAKLYVDGGSPSGTTASSPSWPSQSMFLADRSDHIRKYKGYLDEVRISNTTRDASWITTEYNNQLDPSGFCLVQYEDAPMLSDPRPADGATHVGLNPILSVNVTSADGDLMRIVFMSNASGTWKELGTYAGGSGIYNQTTTNLNKFETKYWWKACVQDSKSGVWVNKTYQFTSISMLELKWAADVPAGGSNQLHPVIGDINGDGQMEVVMSGNKVVVALNGTSGVELWRYPAGVHRAAILVDLTNDGIPEILAPEGDFTGGDRIFALFGNGTLYWRSPVLSGNMFCDFPITAYDIDGDGYPTIYVATEDRDSLTRSGRLTMLNHRGEVLASTPIYHPCAGGPTVADYDFDGVFEVYMGDRNYDWGMGMMSWWAANLTLRWNQLGIGCSSQVPTLIDINKDGKLEVIANNVVNKGFVVLSAANGKILSGYDYRRADTSDTSAIPSHATPTVYDIDCDGYLELIFSVSRDDVLQDFVIFELLGSQRGHIEARIDLSRYNSWCAWPPTLGDVNGDGLMEIIAAIGTEPLTGGDSTKEFPILIYDSPAPDTYRLIAETYAWGAGCLTFARVQDIDGDGLNEVIVAGVNGKVLAYDTVAPALQPRARTEVQYYSEYKRGVAEYVEPPGPPKPLLRDEYPHDKSLGLPVNPTLSIFVHDFQNDPMTIVFSTNASGTWQSIGTYEGGNGIYEQSTASMDKYDTTYFWAVNATDNKGHSTYHMYKFRTMPWWNIGWHYRKTITIDHTKVPSALSNFPVLIDTIDPDLASHAQTDGDDIVFTDSLGNQLNHEIESFDSINDHLVAWVSVPMLSPTEDTILYMYYGNAYCGSQQNPVGVWDPNFLAVYHLGEKSGNVTDSTINHKDAVATQVTTYEASGKMGYAMEFGGSNDFVELPQVCSTETRFTFSAWINASVGARYFISQWTNNKGAFLQVYGNTVEFYINGLRVATNPITLNEWHYVVGTFDGTTARMYVDGGAPSGKTASSPSWPSQGMFLADRSDHFRKYKGFLDEVRVSNVARSASWITTEYNNQYDPSSFYSMGVERSITP